MQRGLGGFPHERLHQDGSREQGAGKREEGRQKREEGRQKREDVKTNVYLMSPRNAILPGNC
ncbi:hypothetical protein [Moorena sp. SIO3H5]|uniref:hypothetical protein n=1 Tax=Moorena sp. SIO3H5 TaxID=2607834 RepID=UPI0013BB0689|nr:hypothetical protein [Moorena sp. SIO3H5]NEO70048.1 hypothetical protein [Moorena sp. SIO3H5]